MQIWPAIDLRGGHCVRLQQGDYDRETVFSIDPVEVARGWQRQGARFLHLVDLDGAKAGAPANLAVIASVVQAVDMVCQVGGGVRSADTIESLLQLGAQRVVIGTKAITAPKWFREMCGRFPGKLLLGLDARDGLVATDGWLQTSTRLATEVAAEFQTAALAGIIYTDIASDGMLSGPNLDALGRLQAVTDQPLIASGGVTTTGDIQSLARLGLAGVIVGRALYERKLDVSEALAAAERVDANHSNN